MPNSFTRTRTAPFAPRRVSGPARRPLPAGASVRGRTSAFERIARLPDYRLVDRVLRSRGCIWLIGILLGGIVAMQVSLLKLNTGISNAIRTQETLEHKNMTLQQQIAEATSAKMIRDKAAADGMVDPEAGNNRFLNSRGPDNDAKRAAKRFQPPSDAALGVVRNNGKVPVPGAAAGVPGVVTPTDTQVTNITPQATATPMGTPEPLPTPVPTPVGTPMATPTPVVTADPALAPEG